MLKIHSKLSVAAVSLSMLGFSGSVLAVDCGPGPHWVDDCPSGIDTTPAGYHWARIKMEIPGIGKINIGVDGATKPAFVVYRGEPEGGPVTIEPPPIPTTPETPSELEPVTINPVPPAPAAIHNGIIRTEIVSLAFEGDTPLGKVTIRAGDGDGNLMNDGPLYSPGVIYESADDPAVACSFFFVTYEMEIESLGGDASVPSPIYGQAYMIAQDKDTGESCTINNLPGMAPVGQNIEYKDPRKRPVYDKDGNIIGYVYHRHPMPVTFNQPLTATTLGNSNVVDLTWSTGYEEYMAGFAVYRGVLADPAGACTDDVGDYTSITMVDWVDSQEGGGDYSLIDPQGDSSLCYGLLAAGFDGTFEIQTTGVQ